MKINIGPIDTLILFGGGPLMVEFAKSARKEKINVYLFAVKRHLNEIVDYKSNLTLKDVLEKEKFIFFETKDINSCSKLKKIITNKTMGIGLGETYTFNKKTIQLFNEKLFDFMTIKLPQYRGGAHFTWQILRGDKTGCWNIQIINDRMIPGVFDCGGIIKTRSYDIPKSANIPLDYFSSSHKEGLNLFKEFINEVQSGKGFVVQDIKEQKSMYFPRLSTLAQGFIDWSWSAKEINDFICAFDEPYPGASTFLNGKRIFVKDCKTTFSDGKFHPFVSGLIYRIHNHSIYVAVKDGGLIIKKILLNDKNIIDSLKVGQRLHTPIKYLGAARLFKAEYNSEGLEYNRH